MGLANSNIVKLDLENVRVYDQLNKFIKRKEYKSENTAMAYEKDIRRFFEVVKGKQIEEMEIEDLNLTLDDFEDFQDYMVEKTDLNPKTINRHFTSVSEFLKYLKGKKFIEFDIDYLSLLTRLPEHSNPYGVLTYEEVFKMADLIMTLPRVRKRLTQHYLILFSYDTCARLDECLNVKWTDFRELENDEVEVKIIAKGNKEIKPKIKKFFYEKLLEVKKETNSEYVFDISDTSVHNMIDKLKAHMPELEGRNIVFHSIRKAAGTFHFKRHNDINQARKSLGHSSVVTTQIYLGDTDYGATGAVSSQGETNDNLYREVDHQTLLEAISQLSKGNQLLLNIKINEILSKK